MKNEDRREGWLIVFDSRPESLKTNLPTTIPTKQGIIKVLKIDINPTAPSKKKLF
jgi:hypothetical protein